MKTLVLSMISIAATVAAMTACTSESDEIDDLNPKDAKVEIKLNAGVVNVETKAQINPTPITGTTFVTPITAKLLRLDVAAEATVRDWTTAADPKDTNITGTAVTLDANHKYYDGDNYTYFVGYYPAGTYSDGIVSYTGLTGEEDIICTNETTVGSKASPATNPSLSFKHLLSQIEIQVKGDLAAQKAFGNITKVELVNIPTSLDLTLGTTAKLAENGTPVKENIIVFEGTQALTKEAASIGAIPMIFNGGTTPLGTSANALKIKITYGDSPTTSEVNVNSMTKGLESGKKHVITLDFKEKIDVSAALVDWDASGEAGNGSVE